MAIFGLYGYSKNQVDHNLINLMMVEQSGLRAGVVARNAELILRKEKKASNLYACQPISYSLSAGYLLLTFAYKDDGQTNLNLYVELPAAATSIYQPKNTGLIWRQLCGLFSAMWLN